MIKQTDVLLWKVWRKHGSVSYLFSCTEIYIIFKYCSKLLWFMIRIWVLLSSLTCNHCRDVPEVSNNNVMYCNIDNYRFWQISYPNQTDAVSTCAWFLKSQFGSLLKTQKKKSISEQTWFFVEFELDFYSLCSLQKSISKSNWFFDFLNLIFRN